MNVNSNDDGRSLVNVKQLSVFYFQLLNLFILGRFGKIIKNNKSFLKFFILLLEKRRKKKDVGTRQ